MNRRGFIIDDEFREEVFICVELAHGKCGAKVWLLVIVLNNN